MYKLESVSFVPSKLIVFTSSELIGHFPRSKKGVSYFYNYKLAFFPSVVFKGKCINNLHVGEST